MTETPNPHIVDADTLTGEMRPDPPGGHRARAPTSGERMASLQGAVDALADTPDVWVTGVSPVYETEPVDAPDDSGPYLNAVRADRHHARRAHRLLDRALAIEDAFDRERGEVPQRAAHPRRRPDRRRRPAHPTTRSLRLPHPRAAERAFVLQPWHDLEPDAVLPGAGPVAEPPGRRRRPRRAGAPRRPGPRDPVTDEHGAGRTGRLRPVSASAHRRAGAARPGWSAGWPDPLLQGWMGTAPVVTWLPRAALRLRGGDPAGGRPRHPRRVQDGAGPRPDPQHRRSTGSCSPGRLRWWARSWPAATSGMPSAGSVWRPSWRPSACSARASRPSAALVMVVAAVLLERACRVRSDGEDA